jgi:hypothetical protein
MGFRGMIGEVVEDRGPVGVRGRRLYVMRLRLDPWNEDTTELAKDALEAAVGGLTSTPQLDRKGANGLGLFAVGIEVCPRAHAGAVRPQREACRSTRGWFSGTPFRDEPPLALCVRRRALGGLSHVETKSGARLPWVGWP